VGVLVVLLVMTNVVTLGVLAWVLLRPPADQEPDEIVTAALESAPLPSGALDIRRIITIEILNPIELAGSRSRMAGIAGSLIPAVTRRLVYDQALKQIRHDMREHNVIADVRLHTVRTDRGRGLRQGFLDGGDEAMRIGSQSEAMGGDQRRGG
jgi:hypothetical protein